MAMATMVPLGIDRFGSFKSPDIETPASKPVTAGKKIPNKTIRGTAESFAAHKKLGVAAAKSCFPKKIEINCRQRNQTMKIKPEHTCIESSKRLETFVETYKKPGTGIDLLAGLGVLSLMMIIYGRTPKL